MAVEKRKRGRKRVHRLHVMANIEDGGRIIAAIPVFKPEADGDTAYPVGLSIQRLHGATFAGGETGFVIRLVGADGNIATMIQRPTGQPATVSHGLLRQAPVQDDAEVAEVDPLPGEGDPALEHGGVPPGTGLTV